MYFALFWSTLWSGSNKKLRCSRHFTRGLFYDSSLDHSASSSTGLWHIVEISLFPKLNIITSLRCYLAIVHLVYKVSYKFLAIPARKQRVVDSHYVCLLRYFALIVVLDFINWHIQTWISHFLAIMQCLSVMEIRRFFVFRILLWSFCLFHKMHWKILYFKLSKRINFILNLASKWF